MTADASLPTITLQGFGGYRHATQSFARPERLDDLQKLIAGSGGRTLVARGRGMSYGDAALNCSGAVISMERLDRFLSLDTQNGILRAEAGVLVADVMRLAVPHGFMLPAVPGLSAITLGGCAAFDIHSKNHWRKGGFGEWVLAMQVLLPTGETVHCSRTETPELFLATIGGLGMTGFIIELTLKLDRMTSSYVNTLARPVGDLPDVFDQFEECLPTSEYAVAWLDLLNFATPRGMLLTAVGGSADEREAPAGEWAPRRAPPLGLIAPFFNTASNQLFNLAFYKKHKIRPKGVSSLRSFLFPWDGLPNWNRLYGRRGFVEYQCCLPMAAAREGFDALIGQLLKARSDFPVYFSAIKRMKQGSGMLSFPLDGYSLLIDIPVKDGLWTFLDQLDEIVIAYGGRVYLAKDGRVSAQAFARMYGAHDRFEQQCAAIDPQGRFSSDMSRRLGLMGGIQ